MQHQLCPHSPGWLQPMVPSVPPILDQFGKEVALCVADTYSRYELTHSMTSSSNVLLNSKQRNLIGSRGQKVFNSVMSLEKTVRSGIGSIQAYSKPLVEGTDHAQDVWHLLGVGFDVKAMSLVR